MLTLALLTQLAAGAPPVTATRFELPNGLRVWVHEDHTRPVALVQVTYKVGSLHEEAGVTGIAHYVEHMVYRATRNIRNEDIYGYVDRIGGRYTGGTWPEFTRYTETVPSWAVESALRVTAERMCCALFDSLEFERERSNVMTEAHGFADTDAISVFRDALMAAAFEIHPYRYNSNTWVWDNLRLRRSTAYDWYKRYYGPNNAVLVVVGDVSTTAVRQLVEKHFGGFSRAPESGEIAIREPPQTAERRITLRHRGARNELVLLYHSPQASDASYPGLVVTRRHLDARLPEMMRAAGISGVKIAAKDSASQYPYVFRISAQTDSTADLEKVLAVIDRETERLARDGISAHDLESARTEPTASQTGRGAEARSDGVPPRRSSLTTIADDLSDGEIFPWEIGDDVIERIRRRVADVTAEEVRDYARSRLTAANRTVGMLIADTSDGFDSAGVGIPPLRTPPARRMRPERVPERALQPLAAIAVPITRRVLENGIVLRAARSRDSAATHVRIALTEIADSAALASAIAGDSVLRSPRTRISWSASGARRIRDSAQARLLRALPRDSAVAGAGAITVAVAGARDPGAVSGAIGRLLRQLPTRRIASQTISTRPGDPGEERVSIPGERQVDVYAGLPGVPRDHPDRRALELLNYIVGVPSYGGRLGWALTKVGLTYASAATTTFGERTGQIVFSTRCDSRNTDATVQAIREVIEGVGSVGVEGWELEEAKAFMLGRTLLYGAREDSDNRAIASALVESEMARIELLDLPALSRAYLSVSLADINRVASRYYRPELLKVVAAGAVPAGREQIFPQGTFRALFEP